SGEENVVVSLADLSRLYLQLGGAYELSSQFAQAESIYKELLTLARALHEPVMECAALNRLATQAAQNSQDLARAEELLQQALAIAESSQNKAGMAETAWNLAQTGVYAAKSEAMEDTWGQINAATQLLPGLLDRGAYGEAYYVGQRAVALARALEITPLLVIILTEWGNVCRANLMPEAAQAAHSEALTRCEDFMPPHYAGWIAGKLCADCV